MADGTSQTATDGSAIDAADLVDFGNLSEAGGTGPLTPAGLDTSQPFDAVATNSIGSYFAAVPVWVYLALAAVVVIKVIR